MTERSTTSPGLRTLRSLLDGPGVAAAIEQLAAEIVSRDAGVDLALMGIHTGGVPLAHRLAKALEARGQKPIAVGMIDITLYRDDAFLGLPQPIVGETEIDFDLTGTRLILVDDVLYTGRTVRAAIDALIDFGRPRRIELCVLVDRGHRELPIQPDYAGLRITTSRSEVVVVRLTELGHATDEVVLREKAP